MTALVLEGVHKRYGDVHALRGLDIEVADNELLVVVGPSGCGKTTALRVVAGLETVDAGSVRIGGRDVTRLDAGDRNLSMVFQNHALFPHLSVAENIGFGMRARGASNSEVGSAVTAAARQVGCEDLLERRPTEISGGERQRVALARGLVRRPEVFLLDEPLSNLDAQLRLQMRRELRRLHDEVGGTMVYVTHDQTEALTLGDRIVVLSSGTVQQIGEPDEVYRRPANRFVASFIGSPSMNLLPAAVEDGRVRASRHLVVPIPPGTRPRSLDGVPLELGIRPEHLHLVDDVATDGEAQAIPATSGAEVSAVVRSVEVAGNEAHIQIAIDDLELTARIDPDRRPAIGATVGVAINLDQIHLFDGATGAAVG